MLKKSLALISVLVMMFVIMSCGSNPLVSGAKIDMKRNNKEDYQKAEEKLQKAIKSNDKDFEAYYYLGEVYFKLAGWEAKERLANYKLMDENFSKSLELSPQFKEKIEKRRIEVFDKLRSTGINSKYNSAASQRKSGNIEKANQLMEEARDYLKFAKTLKADDFYTSFILGNIYFHFEDMENAKKSLEDALPIAYKEKERLNGLEPNDKLPKEKIEKMKASNDGNIINIYKLLGNIELQAKKYDEALANFKKVLEVDEKDQTILPLVASIYASKEDFKNALDYYKLLVKYYPNESDYYYNLGLTYEKLGDTDNAIKTLKKLLEVNNEDYQAVLSLATIYFTKDRYQDVVDVLEKAYPMLDSKEQDRAKKILYVSFAKLGKPDKAMKYEIKE